MPRRRRSDAGRLPRVRGTPRRLADAVGRRPADTATGPAPGGFGRLSGSDAVVSGIGPGQPVDLRGVVGCSAGAGASGPPRIGGPLAGAAPEARAAEWRRSSAGG